MGWVAASDVQYQEAYLFSEILEHRAPAAGLYANGGVPRVDRGRPLTDPTPLAVLATPDRPLPQVAGSLYWLTLLLTLFSWHGPVSVLGRWFGVHQTTIVRWVVGLALAVWPLVSQWLVERVKAQMVSVDAKWLKIQGRWYSGGVVLDVSTELPVVAALRLSRSQWAWRWLGRQRSLLKQVPRVIITDG